jgi:N utilization substance protein A
MTEEDESTRRQSEFEASAKAFTEALNVDEMVAQLLASEGFSSLEEVAYVDMLEIASIEGFDDETAEELQARAKEFIEKQENALDDERKTLGVADELLEIDGLTMPMLVTLGKDDIKTMEDFAGCAADDLIGWTERKDGETKRFPGTLDEYKISRVDADAMVMQARVKAGWITEEELAAANAEPEPEVEEVVEEETKKTGRIF